MGELLIFYLVSVAGETGLKSAMSETSKTGFLTTRPRNAVVAQGSDQPVHR